MISDYLLSFIQVFSCSQLSVGGLILISYLKLYFDYSYQLNLLKFVKYNFFFLCSPFFFILEAVKLFLYLLCPTTSSWYILRKYILLLVTSYSDWNSRACFFTSDINISYALGFCVCNWYMLWGMIVLHLYVYIAVATVLKVNSETSPTNIFTGVCNGSFDLTLVALWCVIILFAQFLYLLNTESSGSNNEFSKLTCF